MTFRIDTCDTVQAVRLGKQMYTQFVGQHTLPSGLLRDLRSRAPSGQNPALVGPHVSYSRACCQAVGCRRHAGLHHLPVPRISSQYGWRCSRDPDKVRYFFTAVSALAYARNCVEKRDGVEEGLQYVKPRQFVSDVVGWSSTRARQSLVSLRQRGQSGHARPQ